TIPDARQLNYAGRGQMFPPPADVGIIDDDSLDGRLRIPAAMERLVDSISLSADELLNPGWNGTVALGSVGTAAEPRTIVVNGDCDLGPATGYGLLVVRGNLAIRGNVHWNGLIVVIGQGALKWTAGASGQISGGVFIARTRENDRSALNPLGSLRSTRGPV